MLRIAIVEDDENDASILKGFLERYSKEKNIFFDIERFKTADAFLFNYQNKFDVIFMDIMMPGTNGMDSARKLREIDEDTILIFVTTIARMAIQGYEVGAMDFILKPLEFPSFSMKMDRAFSKVSAISQNTIPIKTKEGIVTLKEEEVYYVEVSNHKLIYHRKDKRVETYGSLKAAQDLLSKKLFYKINNCFLVNMSHISKIDKYELYLDNDESLAISHPKRAEFIKAYQRFLIGE